MSEKIVAGNLDEVIGKNVEIRDEMREKALLMNILVRQSRQSSVV